MLPGADTEMDDAQPYAFGRGETQAPVMLSGLDRLGEKLGRRLQAILEPIAGGKPMVATASVEVVDFGAWAEKVPHFSSIGVYRMVPLKGNVLLRMDAPMISMLVDCFYGGTGTRIVAARGEFTATETRLIDRLSEALIARLVECWADTLALEPTLLMRETGIGFGAGAASSDQMVVQRFSVSLARDENWPVDIVFPLAALRAVDALTGSKVHDDGHADDPVWQARLERQMRDIRLPARTVLARPSLSLAEVMQLQPGDIIPVQIARSLPLIVGDRVVAHGSIGDQDGRAAFMIEKLS